MHDPGATHEMCPTGKRTPGHVLGGPRIVVGIIA